MGQDVGNILAATQSNDFSDVKICLKEKRKICILTEVRPG